MAVKRDPLLIQANLDLQLQGKTAQNWYVYELSDIDKQQLRSAHSIEPWIHTLCERFKQSSYHILQQLHATSYTRADAATKKDPILYIHTILRLTKDKPLHERLIEAFIRFDTQLQVNLIPLSHSTSINDFIDQIQAKKYT